jgi:hypothetical protein
MIPDTTASNETMGQDERYRHAKQLFGHQFVPYPTLEYSKIPMKYSLILFGLTIQTKTFTMKYAIKGPKTIQKAKSMN